MISRTSFFRCLDGKFKVFVGKGNTEAAFIPSRSRRTFDDTGDRVVDLTGPTFACADIDHSRQCFGIEALQD
jgi:hypothetical protein